MFLRGERDVEGVMCFKGVLFTPSLTFLVSGVEEELICKRFDLKSRGDIFES